MNIKAMFKTGLKVLDDKMPIILTSLGIGGLVTTAVLSGKAAVEAHEILKDYDLNDMEPSERRKLFVTDVLPVFWKPVASCAVSIGCIVGAQMKNASKLAMVAGAYSMKEQAFDDLNNKMKEVLGDKKAKEVKDEIAKDYVEPVKMSDIEPIQWTGYGDTIFLDRVTGVYFKSDIDHVRRAVNDVNEEIVRGEEVTLNDFYYKLNLTGAKIGECIGWDLSARTGQMDVTYSACLMNGEIPVMTLDYNWHNIMHLDYI